MLDALQPGSPPSKPYDAPTPGGNYVEAATPRETGLAYGELASCSILVILNFLYYNTD